jgi:hypothetical protein
MVAAEIDFYSLVVFAHVLAAVAGLGVAFAYPIFWAAARHRFRRSVPYLFATQASIGPRLIGPALFLLIASGLYMAITEDGGFGFDALFVQVGLPIAVVLLAAGPLFFGPSEERLARLAERDIEAAGPGGEVRFSDEFEALYKRVMAAGMGVTVLVAVALFFMSVKP